VGGKTLEPVLPMVWLISQGVSLLLIVLYAVFLNVIFPFFHINYAKMHYSSLHLYAAKTINDNNTNIIQILHDINVP